MAARARRQRADRTDDAFFARNVFINCPFDEKYLPLLRPLLFTIVALGLVPRIALESLDSGQPRFQKILALIEESAFAIHDLSRMQSDAVGEYYRLNMPFELGLDVGCRLYKAGRWSEKRCLILESERFRYRAAISDLSGSDIAVHGNSPELLVAEVRNWLCNQTGAIAPGPSAIWGKFLDFMAENFRRLKERGFSDADIENLPIGELIGCIEEWHRR